MRCNTVAQFESTHAATHALIGTSEAVGDSRLKAIITHTAHSEYLLLLTNCAHAQGLLQGRREATLSPTITHLTGWHNPTSWTSQPCTSELSTLSRSYAYHQEQLSGRGFQKSNPWAYKDSFLFKPPQCRCTTLGKELLVPSPTTSSTLACLRLFSTIKTYELSVLNPSKKSDDSGDE
eukprot:2056981-Amphidinium_carterae.1